MRTISFREECKDLPSTTYVTHGMHSYPAKIIPHIPHYFINKSHFSKPDDIVLDPFCGSGTVLVEAKLSGRNSFGVDINPLARLLTKVKTTVLDSAKLNAILERVIGDITNGKADVQAHKFQDIDYWFSPEVQTKLAIVKEAVEKIEETGCRDFFRVCFSGIIRRCSFADPRISPACKSKRIRKLIQSGWEPQVFELFYKTARMNIRQIQIFAEQCDSLVFAEVIGKNAKEIMLGHEAIDLVITSPPYINAQKYVRSTKLEILWLGLLTPDGLSELDKQLIGTERAKFEEYKELEYSSLTTIKKLDSVLEKIAKFDRRRAYIAYKYFCEMDKVFSEIYRVLRKRGHFVLVIGNNRFYDIGFPSNEIFLDVAKTHHFKVESVRVDTIKSRGLMTKRNKTADMIGCEWVLVLRK